MEEETEKTQLEVLKSSGLLSEFVRSTEGKWNEADLEELLARIEKQDITISPEIIGAILESERVAYTQKIAEGSRDGEATVNFDELGLRKKREYLESEIKRRIR
jgi:hypothetical protein